MMPPRYITTVTAPITLGFGQFVPPGFPRTVRLSITYNGPGPGPLPITRRRVIVRGIDLLGVRVGEDRVATLDFERPINIDLGYPDPANPVLSQYPRAVQCRSGDGMLDYDLEAAVMVLFQEP